MSRLDLADPVDYARFLLVHSAVLDPLETAMEAAGIATLLPDWDRRSRRHALAQDLAEMPLTQPAGVTGFPGMTCGALAGITYVLEGSRLGNAMLVRQVRTAPVPLPVRFMEHGNGEGLWPGFLRWLDGLDLGENEEAQATEAAIAIFELYQQQADRQIPST